MTNIEQHAVFVTLEDDSKHRVSNWLDWTSAIDMWNALDDQRVAVLKDKGVVAFKSRKIKHYEVRSENDPTYHRLPYLDLARGFRVLSREYTTDIAAAKAVLQPLGYYGKAGGWVYYKSQRTGFERAIRQGWWSAAAATGHHVTELPGEKGYRGTVTTMLQVDLRVGVSW